MAPPKAVPLGMGQIALSDNMVICGHTNCGLAELRALR